jgi:YVTN family beta-propeller protein
MDRKNIKIVIVFLLCIISFLGACKKDNIPQNNHPVPNDSSVKVLVACEGSLGNGNGSLSVYFPLKDSIYNDVYQSANGQTLGDVFQSITKINNQYFFCINNSDKIIILNPQNWLQINTINLSKPRYILPVSNNKAYVSSLFSNKVFVINTINYTVEKQISMPYQNPEGMIIADGFAYICNWDTACNKLYKIDTNTDTIIDSITIGGTAPQEISKDREGKLWVLAGNAAKGKTTTFNRLDISTKSLLKTYSFAPKVEAIKPMFNATGDTLYFIEVNYAGGSINNGIYRMRYDDISLPGSALIGCSVNQYYWALGIEPNSGNIYVGDPKGFIQNGTVSIYNTGGVLLHNFNVGLGPGHFYFN